jgi:hypothetical protein
LLLLLLRICSCFVFTKFNLNKIDLFRVVVLDRVIVVVVAVVVFTMKIFVVAFVNIFNFCCSGNCICCFPKPTTEK